MGRLLPGLLVLKLLILEVYELLILEVYILWLAAVEKSSFRCLRCLIMNHVRRIFLVVEVTCLNWPSSLPLRAMVLQHRLPSRIVCYYLVLVVILLSGAGALFELGLVYLLRAYLLVLTARKFPGLFDYVLYLLKLLFIHASKAAKLLNRLFRDHFTISTVFILP